VTQSGSSRELDSTLEVYGPRDASGRYVTGVAQDDDAGWGKLSKASGRASDDGFYLAIVSVDPDSLGSGDYPTRSYRMALSCSGTCATEEPVVPPGLDIRWVVSAAEFGAASVQAYALATARLDALAASGALSGDWGVSLDVDETVLSNVAYQRERAELGVGYTPASWTRWVAARAAPPIPGAKAFVERVRALGGRVALVTNRKAHECADTEANLRDEDVPYDVILCRTGTSDKNPRFESLASGTAAPGLPPLSVVLYVGDNIQDFPGMSQDVRFMGEPALAEFGDRFVVIPNPMYGSWERNAL
jgi:5'-nucleotidase (lipoprotein e(P4) family)